MIFRTPKEVAEIIGVHPETVLSLIRSQKLEAICVSESENSKRPQYRITNEQLAAFIERRSTIKSSPASAKPASGKAKALAALRDVPQHYAD